MFDKRYKSAMDDVKVDETKKDEILDKIMLKEELKRRKNPATPWRIAFACVTCVAVAIGILFVPQNNPFNKTKAPQQSSNPSKNLTVSKSYDEIFELIKHDENWSKYEEYVVETEGAIDYVITESQAVPDSTKPGAATNSDNSAATDSDFSTTTEQVEGVSEADIVKTDGEYIYSVNDTTLNIVKAKGENSALVGSIELSKSQSKEIYGEMFLKGDRIVLLKNNGYSFDKPKVTIEIYDVSDRTAPKKISEVCQAGMYNSSRMVGDSIYLISNCRINLQNIDKDDPTTFVPTTETNGVCEPVPAESIYRYDETEYDTQYTVVGAYNCKDGKLSDTLSLLGGTNNIYCSKGNIILADTRYDYQNKSDNENENAQSYVAEKTVVSRLAISGGKIEYKTSGEVDGRLDNQFFIDEYNGHFRFVTTVTKVVQEQYKFENSDDVVVSYEREKSAALTILDNELKKVGEITDLAKDESVYSVRFMGDIAYFVTFRQTDPLFSADLSDPKNPKILCELKIPGFSEYMYPYGEGLLLGFGMDADELTGARKDLKLSMFDISDPTNVTEQYKTLVDGCSYSPALSDHKAMLVHPDKNLIGFAVTDDWRNEKYVIYEYTSEGFNRKALLDINEQYNYYAMTDIRGLFVEDSFYVVSDNSVQIFDANTFEQVKKIDF